MNSLANIVSRRKSLAERLDRHWQPDRQNPVMEPTNIRYEVSGRVSATAGGGLGMMRCVVRSLGLAELINAHVKLLKRHRPFHESDHILSLTYAMMCGEKTLDGLSVLREDEVFLDALSARRLPHPTTAGDFLRRFDEGSVRDLLSVVNQAGARVWRSRKASARKLAVIDVDGTIAQTTGECREGMSLSYKGIWGYHPLVVSLANSNEFLAVVNRPGNHGSNKNASEWMDYGIRWAREDAGFESVRLRGDSAFALTENFDRWTADDVGFIFGIQAHQSFQARAENMPEEAWAPFVRSDPREPSRKRQTNVRHRVVEEKGWKELVLEEEHVTEWEYKPRKSTGTYRMVALRKRIEVKQGQARLEDEIRYFFYVTNLDAEEASAEEVVRQANARCNQENLIDQLKNGVGATRMPSISYDGNWAYMVIGALAWNLKIWLGLMLEPIDSNAADSIVRMEYPTFVQHIIRTPVQVIKNQARRLVFRLLAVNRWTDILLLITPKLRRLKFA